MYEVIVSSNFLQYFRSLSAVFLWIFLPVYVMEKAYQPPLFHVFAIKGGEVSHDSLYRECMMP